MNNMSVADLKKNILDAENRLKKMVFSHAITPIQNPMSIRILRREIARMKTIVRSKQLAS
ncbi:MAG: 50S ribosomal protein L29 [Chitinophagaceae bacterium]|nr:50S ribosomal protein L29 [Chitinophagaceae bacterium]